MSPGPIPAAYLALVRICKRLRTPGINTKESIMSAYVAWWAVVPARQGGNRFRAPYKVYKYGLCRARIFKLLRRPRIDSKEPITPAYVAWLAGTTNLFLLSS